MSALLLDLYELSMAQTYFLAGRDTPSSFSYMVRKAPFGGAYTLVLGIQDLVDKLLHLRFSPDDIAYLDSLGRFDSRFLRYLETFTFRGTIWAVEDGTAVFPYCPVLQATGSVMELHLISGAVLNTLNHQSLIGTKAMRMVIAAATTPLIELGLRRAHGLTAAVEGSKAAYWAGFSGSSNVAAGQQHGVPVFGSMAHSWVMNHDHELEAFLEYGRQNRKQCIFAVDTFDTQRSGLPNAIRAFKTLALPPDAILGIRIDSGSLHELSLHCRQQLDLAGLQRVKIIVSGDLDEYSIAEMRSANSPVDMFGIGTRLVTADGSGALEGIYKNNGVHLAKSGQSVLLKAGKARQLIGEHLPLRLYDADGLVLQDIVAPQQDMPQLQAALGAGQPVPVRSLGGDLVMAATCHRWEPLLHCQMVQGMRVAQMRSATAIRDACSRQISLLPPPLQAFDYCAANPLGFFTADTETTQANLKGESLEESLHI